MKRKEDVRYHIEMKCKCGTLIPFGHGFYLYGKPIRCYKCGKIIKMSEAQA